MSGRGIESAWGVILCIRCPTQKNTEYGFKNHAPLAFTTATPKPCLRSALTVITITASMFRHRERPAARQRLEQEQEHRTLDDEPGDNDRKRGSALEGEHQGNDTGLDLQPRAAPSRPQSLHPGLPCWPKLRRRRCHHGTCRKNLGTEHHVAAATQAFWPCRSSRNRCYLSHGIDQQPVKMFRPKSANVL